MANKIYTNHTLAEYKKKYGNNKNLKKINKVEVISNKSLLNGRSWWLIDDTYYEIPSNKVKVWWSNLGKTGQIVACCLGGAAVATAVVVPTVIAINNKNKTADVSAELIEGTTGVSIASSKKLDNGAFEITLKPEEGKELESIDKVVIGNQELRINTDYTLVGNVITINKDIIEKHKGEKIVITAKAKEKGPEVIKVTSVEIKNTTTSVEVDGELELSVTVLPENATNKDLDWSIKDNSDIAEIIKKDNKFYLKGKSKGSVTVTATAKDGSGKSSSKSFNVIEAASLEYKEIAGTDTCLVKAKGDKTLPDNVVIPEKDPKTNKTVVGITSNAFGKNLNVKTITFAKPDNITIISPYAFKDNNSLVSFEIPKNVEEIGNGAFSFNPFEAGLTRSLATVTFEPGSKLKKIGNSAFINQWELKSINIPSSVEFIGRDAFYATGLTSATFDDTTSDWVFKGGDGKNEVWKPTTDASANATKLKSDPGYSGIIKNTITISGESSVEEKDTITLSVPGEITVNEWKSSDESKATVKNGVVTGVAVGDCYIYVIAEDGTKVGIKKITVNKKVTTKQQFVDKANEWVTGTNGFCNSKSEYKPSQIEYIEDDVKQTIDGVNYDDEGIPYYGIEGRVLYIDVAGQSNPTILANSKFSGDSLKNSLKKETDEGVSYQINADEIIYSDTNADSGDLKLFKMNKYGYVTHQEYQNGIKREFKYKGIPEIYYNIDWATKIVDDNRTLYDLAKTSSKIVIGTNDEFKSIASSLLSFQTYSVEQSSEETDSIIAYYGINTNYSIELYVLSDGKIRFEDNDLPTNSGFFANCASCLEINLANIDTSKVTSMSKMFDNCSYLTKVDNLANIDTANVNNMNSMFKQCNRLQSLDVSSFNTSKVTDMAAMFAAVGTTSHISEIVGLDKFDTSKVTTMSYMFGSLPCEKLDLSSFDTSSLLNTNTMFSNCQNLKTIFASNKFVTTSITESSGMFGNCLSLVGGAGSTRSTIYALDNQHYEDATYARIDKGDTKETAGYFTEVDPETSFFKIYTPWYENFEKSTKRYDKSGITSLKVDGVTTAVDEIIYGDNPRYALMKYKDATSTLCDFTIAGDDNSPEFLKLYLTQLKQYGYNIITLINDNPGETIGLKVSNGSDELEFVYNRYGYVEKGAKLVNMIFVRLEIKYDGEPK